MVFGLGPQNNCTGGGTAGWIYPVMSERAGEETHGMDLERQMCAGACPSDKEQEFSLLSDVGSALGRHHVGCLVGAFAGGICETK